MPRPLRPIGDGLVYHVITRGNGRQAVFFRGDDYLGFLKALGDLKKRKPFDLYGPDHPSPRPSQEDNPRKAINSSDPFSAHIPQHRHFPHPFCVLRTFV